MPSHHSAAAHIDRSPAGPPPKPVEQTYEYIASLPSTIVKQATLLSTSTANKPHHPPSNNVCTPHPARHYSMLPPFSIKQVFPMLPPKKVDTITATTSAPTVDNMSTPPPLNYIFAHHTTTLSTTPTVSSSSTNASNSRRRHFPAQKKNALHPRYPPPSNLHQIRNMC